MEVPIRLFRRREPIALVATLTDLRPYLFCEDGREGRSTVLDDKLAPRRQMNFLNRPTTARSIDAVALD